MINLSAFRESLQRYFLITYWFFKKVLLLCFHTKNVMVLLNEPRDREYFIRANAATATPLLLVRPAGI